MAIPKLADPSFQGLRVAVFGFDGTEASQIRRIRGFRALGAEVTAFCQNRGNMNADFRPEWDAIDLGPAPNNSFVKRGFGLFGAVRRAMQGSRALAEADLIVARNMDLALVALMARRLAGGRAPLVYECLDIHGLFTRPDKIGRLMRWVERRVLTRSDLLVVSSPGFVRDYFQPMQGYDGPVALVENKLWLGDTPPPRPHPKRAKGPLTIGLVGSIRCQPSVDLLFETARRMGADLRVKFAGNLHDHAVHGFPEALAVTPNAEWTGPYPYPQGLAQAYADCDLVWAQDLWQAGSNSDWLLPNRIYEASWSGCPQIALARTETGRRIASDGLGWVLDAPTPEALEALLRSLTRAEIAAKSNDLLARPDADFTLSPEDLRPMLSPARRVPPPVRREGQAVGT